jgi:ribulose-5-phosphate 4-epimerase/fuculose-1-phosphate aldolase
MSTQRVARISRLRQGVRAGAVTALAVAALAGAGPAAAAHRGGAAAHAGQAPAGTISTVAGGVGGPGRATKVALDVGLGASTCGVSFGAGHVYIGAAGTVRQVTPATDFLATPAGNANTGPLGDGGRAAKAGMDVCGTAVDHSGNLIVGDLAHHRVRVVAASTGTFYGQAMTAGHIYSIAGTGSTGFSGDGGPATKAEINTPYGVAVDPAGNVVLSDGFNQRVRMVAEQAGTFYGKAMTAGHIYTVAGNGKGGTSGDGGPATKAEFHLPQGVAIDAAGNLLITDVGNNRVRVVAARTGEFYGQAMTGGDIYTIAGDGQHGFSGDGGPATSATLTSPEAVAVDAAGNVLIADTDNARIRVVAISTGTFYGVAMTGGDIYTIAGGGTHGLGDGGPAIMAGLAYPQGVTVDSAGNVVVADTDHRRTRVVAATTGTFYGQAMTAGHIYTIAGTGRYSFSGDRGLATRAEFSNPSKSAVDHAGNLIVADSSNGRIRVAAASTGTFYGQAMTAGHIDTVAGGGKGGDGGPATSAQIRNPEGVTADAAGNLVIADTGHNRVRVVAATTGTFYGQAMTAGDIYTIAGDGMKRFSGDGGPATSAGLSCTAVAVDAAGNLVIADIVNNRVRVVAATTGTFYGQPMTAGDIYTVAGDGTHGFSGDGGPATSAELGSPIGVTIDAAGNLAIADTFNSRIRVVATSTGTFYGQAMTAGHIYTVAGTGTFGFSGDGGPATSAELGSPYDVAAGPAGNLVIADTDNSRIRVVATTTGIFYGKLMTAGDIYTVAGNGGTGFSGDGGPAARASLADPTGVTVNAAGDLVITDNSNDRIRVVTR